MFGFLKKRLKKAVEMLTGKKEPKEETTTAEAQAPEKAPKPERLVEQPSQQEEPKEQAVEEVPVPTKELIEEKQPEKIETLEEVEEEKELEELEQAEEEKPTEEEIKEIKEPEEAKPKETTEVAKEEAREVLEEELEKEPEKVVEELEKEAKELLEESKEILEETEPKEVVEKLEKEAMKKEKEKIQEKIVSKPVEEKVEKPKTGLGSKIIGLLRRPKKPEEVGKPGKPEKAQAREEIKKEVKKEEGFLAGILKKVKEKILTEEDVQRFLDEMQTVLLENNVALEVVDKISEELKKNLVGKSVNRKNVNKVILNALKDSILSVLKQEPLDIEDVINACKSENRPCTILLLGFNGTGKTTTLAKLGNYLKKNKHDPVFAAADTFRAAALEQIEIHAKNLGVDLVKHDYGADAAAVVFDAKKHAEARGKDVVLVDTAGRNHADVNLMDELKKICRVNNPDLKILVIDTLTGNDAVEQAKKFNDAVGIDGIILAKADVAEKAGAALSVGYVTGKPIIFMGTGQGYDDIVKFEPEKIVEELLK